MLLCSQIEGCEFSQAGAIGEVSFTLVRLGREKRVGSQAFEYTELHQNLMLQFRLIFPSFSLW